MIRWTPCARFVLFSAILTANTLICKSFKYIFEFCVFHLLVILFFLLLLIIVASSLACESKITTNDCKGKALLNFLLLLFIIWSNFGGVEYIIEISLRILIRGVPCGYYVSFSIIKNELELVTHFNFDVHLEALVEEIVGAVFFLLPWLSRVSTKNLNLPLGVDIFRNFQVNSCHEYFLIKQSPVKISLHSSNYHSPSLFNMFFMLASDRFFYLQMEA